MLIKGRDLQKSIDILLNPFFVFRNDLYVNLLYYMSEMSRLVTWPWKYIGKATPVWQLTLSHHWH